ncbi:hypothetical protein SLEP1_g42920 [Rubroshorea leprosula]|uniref:Uncharacterized protein n=1 Tax=Rubroshorea leprosula TaxID=152421 RepID=A0AAV5LCV1_9ROSI|nr:hypothetical protein SLEP1_g42920 [Rubroshorea leprosula]
MLVMPLFKDTGSLLPQMEPPNISVFSIEQMLAADVTEVSQAHFWELVPGHAIGSISLLVKKGIDDRPVLEISHDLCHDLGTQQLAVQTGNE